MRVPYPDDSSDNVQALPPGTMLGDYRLDAVIGHGGFGITYRAFDSQLAKFVAIKEYLPVEFAVREGDERRGARRALRRRFRLGPRALPRRGAGARPLPPSAHRAGHALLRRQRHGLHRHGVRGRQQRGRDAAPARPAACRPTRCAAWPKGCCSGWARCMRRASCIATSSRRNIIIRRDGVPVLIDFGAARQAMGERTRTLTGVLTPQYAPIEQYAVDGKQGPWSDIYSAAARAPSRDRRDSRRPKPPRRVGKDPYRPLVETQARPLRPGVPRRRSIARWPSRRSERPQSVEEWSKLFGLSLRARRTMRRRSAWAAARGCRPTSAPRRGGVSRETARTAHAAARGAARRQRDTLVLIALAVMVGAAVWRLPGAAARPRGQPLPQVAQPADAVPAEASAARLDAGADADPAAPRRRPCRRRRRTAPSRRRRSSWRTRRSAPACAARAVFERAKEAVGRRAHHGGRSAHRRRRAPRGRAWRMPSGSPTTTARPMSARWPTASARDWASLEFKRRRSPGRRMEGRSS